MIKASINLTVRLFFFLHESASFLVVIDLDPLLLLECWFYLLYHSFLIDFVLRKPAICLGINRDIEIKTCIDSSETNTFRINHFRQRIQFSTCNEEIGYFLNISFFPSVFKFTFFNTGLNSIYDITNPLLYSALFCFFARSSARCNLLYFIQIVNKATYFFTLLQQNQL